MHTAAIKLAIYLIVGGKRKIKDHFPLICNISMVGWRAVLYIHPASQEKKRQQTIPGAARLDTSNSDEAENE